jgi:hypothetical protein
MENDAWAQVSGHREGGARRAHLTSQNSGLRSSSQHRTFLAADYWLCLTSIVSRNFKVFLVLITHECPPGAILHDDGHPWPWSRFSS